jgi:hypothetical protein
MRKNNAVFMSIKEYFEFRGIESSFMLENQFEKYINNKLNGLKKCGIKSDNKYLLDFLQTPLTEKRLRKLTNLSNENINIQKH